MKPVLSVLEPEHFSEKAFARLQSEFTVYSATPGCETHCHWDTVVLWVRLKDCIPFNLYPATKLIACNCTDVSHLPLDECKRRGIEVLSLRGIEGLDDVHATAEHTVSLMLQALRLGADRSSGRIGRELRGKKVCIVGGGRVGKQVIRLVEAFGAEAWIHGSGPSNWADIVTVHASLNETSKGLIGGFWLHLLKPGCILVNTARDAIVDRLSVLQWLERDSAAIYAHDFADQWPGRPFTEGIYERVIGTPHIGGWTIESLHKTEELLAEKVIEWAKARMEVSV